MNQHKKTQYKQYKTQACELEVVASSEVNSYS
jgi:hypothetical protein